MDKYKTLCQHCGKKYTAICNGYENKIECKKCKKDMNTIFDFLNKKLTLY